MIYLQPVLPKMAEDVEKFLNIEKLTWKDIKSPLLNYKINEFNQAL